MSAERITWGGNLEVQSQADDAWKKLQAGQKPKPKNGRRRKPKRFQGTYHEYIQSSEWEKKRRKAFRHYGRKCGRCGSTSTIGITARSFGKAS